MVLTAWVLGQDNVEGSGQRDYIGRCYVAEPGAQLRAMEREL